MDDGCGVAGGAGGTGGGVGGAGGLGSPAGAAGDDGAPARADWRHHARCRHDDPEALFVQGARQRDAREVCRPCHVRTECLAHALDNRIDYGVWGGMTERERRAVLRRRPDVVSWAALLDAARRDALRRHAEAARAAGATGTARPAVEERSVS